MALLISSKITWFVIQPSVPQCPADTGAVTWPGDSEEKGRGSTRMFSKFSKERDPPTLPKVVSSLMPQL